MLLQDCVNLHENLLKLKHTLEDETFRKKQTYGTLSQIIKQRSIDKKISSFEATDDDAAANTTTTSINQSQKTDHNLNFYSKRHCSEVSVLQKNLKTIKCLIQKQKKSIETLSSGLYVSTSICNLQKRLQNLQTLVDSSSAEVDSVRRQIMQQLLILFPIKTTSESAITLRGFEISSILGYIARAEDFISSETWSIGTSLGLVVHLALLMSRYLNIPLRCQICLFSSKSVIKDGLIEASGGLCCSKFSAAKVQKPFADTSSMTLSTRLFFSLLEPLYYFEKNQKRSYLKDITEIETYPVTQSSVFLRWFSTNPKIHNFTLQQRANHTQPGINLMRGTLLTPSGILLKQVSLRGSRLGSDYTTRTSAACLQKATMPPALRPPLHPVAAFSLYSTISQNASSPSSIIKPYIRRSISQDFSSIDKDSSIKPFSIASSVSSSITFLEDEQDQYPLYLKSSSTVDRNRFIRGLRMLKASIDQLFWEYENQFIDSETRFHQITTTTQNDKETKNLTGVQNVQIFPSDGPPPVGDSRWDKVSILQPLVFAASTTKRRAMANSNLV